MLSTEPLEIAKASVTGGFAEIEGYLSLPEPAWSACCRGRTPPLEPPERDAAIASVNDVSMKMMAAQVVAFVRALAAERGPKAVWLPMPPKAAAMSALLPLWSRTTPIRKRQTMMCTAVMSPTNQGFMRSHCCRSTHGIPFKSFAFKGLEEMHGAEGGT